MSANVGVLHHPGAIGAIPREAEVSAAVVPPSGIWKPDEFAREQIRGLVRRVFFADGIQSIKQVVFCAAESNINVAPICDQVARTLARETCSPIALMGRHHEAVEAASEGDSSRIVSSIKSSFNQLAASLWYVERSYLDDDDKQFGTALHWLSCLTELREEFEYAIIEGPPAGASSEAALLGQMTDGLILVLGAHSTRKATAQKIKQNLQGAQSRILGTVLSERQFPIPVSLYNRL